MTTIIHRKHQSTQIRFCCFLDDLHVSSDATTDLPTSVNADTLIVDPTFQFQVGTTIPLPLVHRARFRERFQDDSPIAWVEDSATKMLRPFWVRRQDIWQLRNLRRGNPLSEPLASDLAAKLRWANILTSTELLEQRREFGNSQALQAAIDFTERDLCVISNLFHPAHLRALGQYYRKLIQMGEWSLGDAQVEGRFGWNNELLARFFQHQLTSYVGQSVGTPVKPSYAYVSAYQGGAVLKPHLDREQCEFTVSLLVERTTENELVEWPIYFDTPRGTVELLQSVGEAILFRGTKLPHYRPRLADGQTYLSLLFHYVPVDFHRTLY
jgi:hypothetical protein